MTTPLKTKTVKITLEQYNRIYSTGPDFEPFYSKLERLLAKRTKAVRTKQPKKETKPEAPPLGEYFKQAYKEAFGLDYPSWGPRENSQIKNWAKSLKPEQAKWCIRAYMGWLKPKAVESGHSLGVLVTSHVELVTDQKRAVAKQQAKDQYKEQKKDVEIDAYLRRGKNDPHPRIDRRKEVPVESKGRLSKGNSKFPDIEEPFAIPSGFDIE